MTAVNPTIVARMLLTGAAVAAIAVIGGRLLDQLRDERPTLPIDFVAFWSVGHLNATGENPYSAENVRAVQRSLGWDGTAIMMWYPPWVVTLVTPLGLMPIDRAYHLWLLLNLTMVSASVHLLWLGLGGLRRLWWVPQAIAATFTPTVFLIGSGQLTGIALLGLAGFVYFIRHDRSLLAGAFAALTAVKPHLLTLYALWLFVGSLRSGFARRVVLGGVVVGLAVVVATTFTNPHAWQQHLNVLRAPTSANHHHLSDWTPPLIGWWLRQAVPGHPFFVQWLPLILAFLAIAIRACATRSDPGEERIPLPDSPGHITAAMPFVVACSLLVAPYGAWEFDLVLLLPLVLAVAVQLSLRPSPRGTVTGMLLLAGVNAASLAMMLLHVTSEWYVWVAPVVLLQSMAVLRLNAGSTAAPAQAAGIQPSPVGA